MRKFVITGIGTDVGKTIVSAIIAESMGAAYWKPVQAGDLDNSDSIKIQRLTSNVEVIPEAFRLSRPMSPHAAATIDNVKIELSDLIVPKVSRDLIIEGAGGIMVPINSSGLIYADVFETWQLPVIIVSRHYLGSINHSLMTAEILQKRGIEIAGFIFVGNENPSTEEIICRKSGVSMLARIPEVEIVDRAFIAEQASKLNLNL